jgi:hypothetical protein
MGQNFPCAPAQCATSALKRAEEWISSGRSRTTKRTLPVSIQSCFRRGKVSAWKRRQYGHW